MSLPEWLELVEHTADEGIDVRAPTRRRLYERAALGMFTVLTDTARVRPRREVDVSVAAADPEELLVVWLSELNVRHQLEHTLFCEFEVLECTETVLMAQVRGESFDPVRHELLTEIKAVTYCGLVLEQTGDGWHARVIFDL